MIRRLSGWTFRIVLLLLAIMVPFAIGFLRFAGELPAPTGDPAPTDAIVVLTGGSDRIAAGLTLLEAGKAKKLFVSGVHPGVELADLLKLDWPSPEAEPISPVLSGRIALGHESGDTFGNAEETAVWMRANRLRSMRLVTADYHMRRALIEFKMAGPDLGILPNPVRSSVAERWRHDPAAFRLLIVEYGKYIVAKWRYLLARANESKAWGSDR